MYHVGFAVPGKRACGPGRIGVALRFEVWGLWFRVLDAFRPRGATLSGQAISPRPEPRGRVFMTHKQCVT